MLISHYRRFIFVHIPKTGGTSVHHALARLCSDSLPRPHKIARIDELPDTYIWQHPWQHASASRIRERVGEDVWHSFLTFAFVRHPWARLVSLYNMLGETANGRWIVPDFATWIEYADGDRVINQIEYVSDADGNPIVGFVGRFETLERDFDWICAQLGVTAQLEHMNLSAVADYREFYTSRLRQLVAERFARDIAAFGYEF